MIHKTVQFLRNGNVILCPTDTIYGLGCDATNNSAIKKIYSIKQRSTSKSLIILVASLEMLQNYVQKVPKEILDYLKKNKAPTTVIYNNPTNLAKNIIAKDNTIGIRIVNKGFIYELIKAFGKPIVSTSANVSGQVTPTNFEEIDESILSKVDYIVNLQHQKINNKPSTILKFVNGKIEILRK